MTTNCRDIVSHINRIKGQMDALKDAIEKEKSCADIAHLIISICASCDSVRNRMIQHYLKEIVNKGKNGMECKEWETVMSLIKR